MKRLLLSITGYVLAVCCLLCAFAALRDAGITGDVLEYNRGRNDASLETVRGLCADAEALEAGGGDYDAVKLEYVEGVVTDSEGTVQLEEGQVALSAGEAELADGQARYDAGAAQLAAAEAQYAAGQAKLEAGRQAYAEGEARLAEGKAELAEGEAQLAAAKQVYAEGEAKLSQAEPIYNTVMPLYSRYLDAKAQYDAAVAEGDTVRAALLYPAVAGAERLYTQQLGGYSIGGIISDYQTGQAQLAEGAARIAEGEAKLAAAREEIAAGEAELAAAKAQLDEGQAQLDAAAIQLNAARGALAAAGEQLDAGYEELDEGRAQLDAGVVQLEENRVALADNLDTLSRYEDTAERVSAGADALKADAGIAAVLTGDETPAQVCAAALKYLEDEAKALSARMAARRLLDILAAPAAVLGLAAAVAGVLAARLRGKKRVAAALCLGVAALLAALALTVWGSASGALSGACRLADGSGSGMLRSAALVAQLCAAGLFTAMAGVAFRACTAAPRATASASDEFDSGD